MRADFEAAPLNRLIIRFARQHIILRIVCACYPNLDSFTRRVVGYSRITGKPEVEPPRAGRARSQPLGMLQQVMAYDSQSLPRSKHILVGVDKTGL
jgi:hypothetical protein